MPKTNFKKAYDKKNKQEVDILIVDTPDEACDILGFSNLQARITSKMLRISGEDKFLYKGKLLWVRLTDAIKTPLYGQRKGYGCEPIFI